MNRSTFKTVSGIRLREARILLSSRQYSGAYYLCGYPVECGLKACIAKHVRRSEFPDRKTVVDSYTHDLTKLVRVAGLGRDLESRVKADPGFADNWAVVKDWREDSRYERIPREMARDLISAITDSEHGILVWLRQYW